MNTTIISNTFDKKELKKLFDKEINDTVTNLEYYGPKFDMDNINKETNRMMNILDGFTVKN
jgi:hypothetical protein